MSDLRTRVCQANHDLVAHGLVLFTWGNASAMDWSQRIMYIKPSGVDYDRLTAETIVAVRLDDGAVIGEGRLRPSSDTATHLALYRAWGERLGGIIHTHSEYATAIAQAGCGIPAQGTTHADYFADDIPCCRPLTQAEVEGAYEANTGQVIIETFQSRGLDPLAVPGCLVSQHAPFAWGASVEKAVYHGAVLERLARMRVHTCAIDPSAPRVPQFLLDRHYQRKHGPGAYYGQT